MNNGEGANGTYTTGYVHKPGTEHMREITCLHEEARRFKDADPKRFWPDKPSPEVVRTREALELGTFANVYNEHYGNRLVRACRNPASSQAPDRVYCESLCGNRRLRLPDFSLYDKRTAH